MKPPMAVATACILAGCGRQAAIETLQLPATAGAEQGDPALAVDPANGNLLFTFSTGDTTGYAIMFARSTDGGSTWSTPVTAAGPALDIRPHGESAPRLVATRHGVLAVVWSNNVPVAGRQWPASNVRFARSADGGRTWSAALTLNDDSSGAPAGHLFHGAAWDGDSALVVTWLDERTDTGDGRRETASMSMEGHEHSAPAAEPDAHVFLARSADLGATWTARNRSLWGGVCPCCRITLTRGPDGQVMSAWRKHYPGDIRDVVVAPLSATEPTRVHEDGWVYPGCPHTGPGIGVDSQGVAHVAWFVGKVGSAGVFYSRQTSPGAATYTDPLALVSGRTLPTAHSSVAVREDGGAWITWDVASDGRRIPQLASVSRDGRLGESMALDTLEGGDHPQIVRLGDGAVVVAWTQTTNRSTVKLVRVH